MKKLCIIPARGGSKRIPGKNIREFCGKPIISYSIESALESDLFDEVMVSTDDETIASIAKEYGASIPFIRSRDNANDTAGITEVLIEVIQKYRELGEQFDVVCCVLPTAPFVSSTRLTDAFKQFESTTCTSLFPVAEFSYPIQRSLRVDGDTIKMRWPENFPKRSQDLEASYHDAGQFYFIETDVLFEEKKLFTSNSGFIVLSNLEVQDIDTNTDWKLAELKYKLLSNESGKNI